MWAHLSLWLLVWDPSGLSVVIQNWLTSEVALSLRDSGTLNYEVHAYSLLAIFCPLWDGKPLARWWKSSPVNNTNLDTSGLFTWLNSRQRNRPPGFRTRWASWSAWARQEQQDTLVSSPHSTLGGWGGISFCGHYKSYFPQIPCSLSQLGGCNSRNNPQSPKFFRHSAARD